MSKSNSLVFIIYGGPGSGKSTQSALLAKYFKAPYLNMGNALRQLAKGQTRRAKSIEAMINRGLLVPTALTNKIAESFFKKHAKNRLLISDGYPRNLAQARNMLKLVRQFKRQLVFVFLDLPMRTAIERLMKRAKIEERPDDANPRALQRRVRIFKAEAKKLLAIFKDKQLVRVSGQGSIKEINQRLVALVKKYSA